MAEIQDVSDTALWVASYRARESARPRAIIQDPYAARLAGERGAQLASSLKRSQIMSWVMAIRTVAIDRLIEDALSLGVDTIINLGAGLDARPYRMRLPSSLRWVEIDFPHMISYKTEVLKSDKPVCQLERIPLDLSSVDERAKILSQIGSRAQCALVLTEGVLPYLSNDAVAALARALHDVPTFRFWIQDYIEGGLGRRVSRSWIKKLKAAPFLFHVEDWFGFFRDRGWTERKRILAIEESKRLKRYPPFMFPASLLFLFMSPSKRKKLANMSGYALLERIP